MKTNDAIKLTLDSAHMIVSAYVEDLSDADLMKRPHAQCNHLNWQIGHLIESEHAMLSAVVPGGVPSLPEGFAAMYTRETRNENDPSKFCNKATLMATYKQQRDATLAALAKVQDSEWSKETGISYAPTLASLYNMIGCHWLMHCGQWVIVRRELGKPVVI